MEIQQSNNYRFFPQNNNTLYQSGNFLNRYNKTSYSPVYIQAIEFRYETSSFSKKEIDNQKKILEFSSINHLNSLMTIYNRDSYTMNIYFSKMKGFSLNVSTKHVY